MNETQEALKLATNAKYQIEQALREAENDKQRAEQALAKAKQDADERYKAQEKARNIERATERSKMTYKSLFIGNGIFTLILAFFVAYSKRGVLVEMFQWFPSRWKNLVSFLSWIAMSYMAAIQFIQKAWKLHWAWNYLIITLLFLGLAVVLFFVLKLFIGKVKVFLSDIKQEYKDATFKGIVSGNIALGMLYICLFFADPIKTILPFNILSIWFILSFIGISLWHIPEIKNIIEKRS